MSLAFLDWKLKKVNLHNRNHYMYGPYKIMNTKGTYANWYGYLDGDVVAGPYATRTVVVEEILHWNM